ncbi:hypothetical protein GPALN_006592 [Globodera pallida]|nr:hypothetical protein GPALN_006592 [Globodera pallida]
MQHILLDNLYMDYFLDNSATDQSLIMQKIAIYTHIYMMKWTIEKNKDKLSKRRTFRPTDGYNAEGGTGGTSNNAGQNAYEKIHQKIAKWEQNGEKWRKMFTFQPVADGHADGDGAGGTSNKMGQNAYEWLCLELKIIFSMIGDKMPESNCADETPESNCDSMHFGSHVTMCYLLKFKFELSHTLSATTNFGIFPHENVSCKSAENIRQSVEMNLEPIREWMLSDLVHFFKRRPKLVKYFDKLHKRNNESEIVENRQKFVALFGSARTALFYDIHFENFGFFALVNEKNISNTLLYKEFLEQNNKLGKWRAKILLDKYLYSEWFKTFYDNEMKAVLEGGQCGEKLHTKAILADLHCFWDCFGNDFWLNEKNIRKAIGQFVKKNGGKISKLKQPFLVQCRPLDWVKCQQNETDGMSGAAYQVRHVRGDMSGAAYQVRHVRGGMSGAACRERHIRGGMSGAACRERHIRYGMLGTTCRERHIRDDMSGAAYQVRHVRGGMSGAACRERHIRDDMSGAAYQVRHVRGGMSGAACRERHIRYGMLGTTCRERHIRDDMSGAAYQVRHVRGGMSGAACRERHIRYGMLGTTCRERHIRDDMSGAAYQVRHVRGGMSGAACRERHIRDDMSGAAYQVRHVRGGMSGAACRERHIRYGMLGTTCRERHIRDDMSGAAYQVRHVRGGMSGAACRERHIRYGMLGTTCRERHIRDDMSGAAYQVRHVRGGMSGAACRERHIRDDMSGAAYQVRHVRGGMSGAACRERHIRYGMLGTTCRERHIRPSTSTDCLEKAMEMLTNVKMRRVGKDIDDQVENIPALINHQKDDDVIRITQFGSYKMKTFKNVLIQLHTHMVAFLCAKKFAEIPSKNEQNAKLLNLEKLYFIFNAQEMLLKKVGTMNIMLKQQQIGNPIICESSQYNLIRTNPANRQNDGHLSNGIVQFITPFCAGEEKNSMIDQIKGQIASVLKKWVQKVANFEQPLLLTSGSHLMSSDLDSSDLDLLCVVPDQIHLLTFYGESDTTLYSTLKKDLIGAKLSWIAGKVPLIRIEFGPVELDLLLVPVPIKYLTEKEAAAAKLESDQVIKDICNVKGIYSLAGYRSGKFQLSLVNDKQLNWPADAVLLDKLSKVSLNVLVNGWPPKFGESSMTVITPKFPEQNAAFNEVKYAEEFAHFAIILCADVDAQRYATNCGFYRSKIRRNLFEWATATNVSPMLAHYQIIPQSEEKTICNISK